MRDAGYYIDDPYTNTGAYLQDAITMFDHSLVMIGGARMDKHSMLEDVVISPRVNARLELSHDLSLRLAYTTGFKAPQVFDEDLHIESLGGTQRVIRNVEGLRPERSRSFTANLDYNALISGIPVLVGITAFHTGLVDAFSMTESSIPGSDLILWQRVNSGGGQVSGVEADFGIKPLPETEVRIGGVIKRARYDQPQEIFDGVHSDRFLYTPGLEGHARVTQLLSDDISILAAVRYTGTLVLPDATAERLVETTETFFDIDFGATIAFPISVYTELEVSAGVKNLLDAYQSDLQRGVENSSGKVSLRLAFVQ